MSIKLVAIDMDDTLLGKSLIISPRTIQAIRSAISQGVTVTLATGRMFQSALPFAKQLGLNVPLITYNGALIKAALSGEELFHQPIGQQMAANIMMFCRENDWHIQIYVNDTLYVYDLGEKTQIYAKIAGITPVALGDKLYDVTETPTKMLLIDDPALIPAIRDKFVRRFGSEIYITSSKPRFLEMTHSTVNKGWALAYLAEKLGVVQNEVMAIGDSYNDIPMLEYAGLGVAMANADDVVKAAANEVTLSSEDEGVAQAIEKFVLQ